MHPKILGSIQLKLLSPDAVTATVAAVGDADAADDMYDDVCDKKDVDDHFTAVLISCITCTN